MKTSAQETTDSEDKKRVEYYFVTRTYCLNCEGIGYFSNPITQDRHACVDCKGEGFKESRERLYSEEAEKCKTVIDWNAEPLSGRVS